MIPSANRAMVGCIAGGGRIDKPILKAGRAFHKYRVKRNSWPKVKTILYLAGTLAISISYPQPGLCLAGKYTMQDNVEDPNFSAVESWESFHPSDNLHLKCRCLIFNQDEKCFYYGTRSCSAVLTLCGG